MKRYFLTGLCASLLAGYTWGQDSQRREGAPPEPLKTPPTEKLTPIPAPCGCGPTPCGPTLKEHQILVVPLENATTLPRVTVRADEKPCKEKFLQIEWKEEQRKVMELVTRAKDVERTIMCSRMEKKEVVDPCTGCKNTVYCEVEYPEKVVVKVYETVSEERIVVVKVPCLKTAERDIVVKRFAVDVTKQPAIATRYTIGELKQEIPVPTCPPACPVGTTISSTTSCGCKK